MRFILVVLYLFHQAAASWTAVTIALGSNEGDYDTPALDAFAITWDQRNQGLAYMCITAAGSFGPPMGIRSFTPYEWRQLLAEVAQQPQTGGVRGLQVVKLQPVGSELAAEYEGTEHMHSWNLCKM